MGIVSMRRVEKVRRRWSNVSAGERRFELWHIIRPWFLLLGYAPGTELRLPVRNANSQRCQVGDRKSRQLQYEDDRSVSTWSRGHALLSKLSKSLMVCEELSGPRLVDEHLPPNHPR